MDTVLPRVTAGLIHDSITGPMAGCRAVLSQPLLQGGQLTYHPITILPTCSHFIGMLSWLMAADIAVLQCRLQAAVAAGAGKAHINIYTDGAKVAKIVGPKRAAQFAAASKAMGVSVKHSTAAAANTAAAPTATTAKPSSPGSYGASASAAAAAAATSRPAGRVVPSRLCQPTASSLAKAKPGHGPAAAAPGSGGETKPRLKSKVVVHKAPAAAAAAVSSEEMEDEHASAAAAGGSGKVRVKSKVVVPSPAAPADPSLKSLKGQVKEKLAEKASRKVEAEAAQQKSRKVSMCYLEFSGLSCAILRFQP